MVSGFGSMFPDGCTHGYEYLGIDAMSMVMPGEASRKPYLFWDLGFIREPIYLD